ncbi:MAG: hypothetical protein NZZ41_05565 [Candidatus Dojkabacteria bacterium]|nr:hypothetical protein [Candidatus Dojkabacteria bacterium]
MKKKYTLLKLSEWLREYWRSLCALVYILICLFDFMIMPIVYTSIYNKIDTKELLLNISQLDTQAQVVAVTSIIPSMSREWKPLTLQESGLFHISFGAILTGAALMGGLVRNNLAKNGINPYDHYYQLNKELNQNENDSKHKE